MLEKEENHMSQEQKNVYELKLFEFVIIETLAFGNFERFSTDYFPLSVRLDYPRVTSDPLART